MTADAILDSQRRLTESPATHWNRYPAVICDRDGCYCLAWYRYPSPETGIPCQIFFCRGTDSLDSIAARAPVQVTDDGRNHTGPSLCQDGDGCYWLAWHCWPQRKGPRSLLFACSKDGHAWSPPAQPLPQIAEYMIYPSLAWHPAGKYWITFSAGLGEESLVYLSSSENGKNWTAPVAFAAGVRGEDKSTLTVGANGQLLMAWRFLRDGRHGLRWSASDDGVRWQGAGEIIFDAKDVDRPKLSVDNSEQPWLAFEDAGSLWTCKLERNLRWSTPVRLRSELEIATRPSALVQNKVGAYWIAWSAQRTGVELWGGKVTFRAHSS